MDLRNAPESRNVVNYTNYLTDPLMAGVDPAFLAMLLQSFRANSPSTVLMQKKYRDQVHNYDPAYDAFMRSAVQKYGKIDDRGPPEVMRPREE